MNKQLSSVNPGEEGSGYAHKVRTDLYVWLSSYEWCKLI